MAVREGEMPGRGTGPGGPKRGGGLFTRRALLRRLGVGTAAAVGLSYVKPSLLTVGVSKAYAQSIYDGTPTPPPTPTPTPPPPAGLTPGYWKNQTDAWVGYAPGQLVNSVFTVPSALGSLGSSTLLQALGFGGGPGVSGGAQLLLRAAVAALLNAASPSVNYPLTTGDVISQVNAALASLNRDTMLALASQLDAYNNLGT